MMNKNARRSIRKIAKDLDSLLRPTTVLEPSQILSSSRLCKTAPHCHTARIVQKWMDENFGSTRYWGKQVWPPSSSDLNSLDFSVWAPVEACASREELNNLNALKQSISRAWNSALTMDSIWKMCGAFRQRVEMVIAVSGKMIEKECQEVTVTLIDVDILSLCVDLKVCCVDEQK